MAGCAGLLCLLVAFAAGASPYSVVAERNIFGLKDPPPPPSTEPEPEPPPNLKLTGITTIMGVPRALMKVQVPAKPPQPAKDESYIMVAGGPAQAGVEVLEINDSMDLKDVKVKVRQAGKEFWLTLEKSAAPKAGPVAAAPPGANPAQVAAAQAAAQKLAAARASASGGVPPPGLPGTAIPARPVRTAEAGGPGAPGAAGTGLQAAAPQVNRTHVARNYGLTREEQVILIEANREMTIEDVALGNMPPLPPTELTRPELDPTVPPETTPENPMLPPGAGE